MIGGRPRDPRAVLSGTLVMAVGVLDTHHHGVRGVHLCPAQLGQDDGSVADVELGAMIRDSQPRVKPKAAQSQSMASPMSG
jgi:hypothetical protein